MQDVIVAKKEIIMYYGILEEMSWKGKKVFDMNREELYTVIEHTYLQNEELQKQLLEAQLKGVKNVVSG